MGKGRVEAFTDGVVAIIITIMVLELKVPHGEDFSALLPLWPIFFSYVLSFINVGIYWNNLHNMFHTVQRVDGRVLWANLNLLFWLSLMPATTAFMGREPFRAGPRRRLWHRPGAVRGRLHLSRHQAAPFARQRHRLRQGAGQ
ncbi:TMEM175 family protein [Mesorhizobium sp. M0179]|uniref:TMEM175 family protein n=1 Tax=unclassified Mesorhizobium TaxID=325217 RepID=UPI00041578F2|nr:TMEM175 family protein [Mesorhizobium sp. LSJC265A00]